VRHRSRIVARICGALTAGAALLGAAPDAGVEVSVHVEGLRSTKGQVLACLTAQPRAFPNCRDAAQARSRLAIPASEAGTINFGKIEKGTYAIALLHDENGNGRVDMVLIMPKEGFGFSRNPPVRTGPPSFASASFVVGDVPVRQTIRMRYIF
jgi:uncharacterized protein (DUF2141 family)